MRQLIKEYFSFTRKERIAVMTLVVLIVAIYLLPQFIRAPHNPPVAEEIQEIREFRSGMPAGVPSTLSELTGGEHSTENKRPARLFYFDPNTISETDWEELGLRDKTIRTIRNFLSKGGHFYKTADLKKIYGLKENEFERISPYVKIAGRRPIISYNDEAKRRHERDTGSYAVNRTFKGKATVVDINTAGLDAFIALPGIGNTLAARIINFREKLGGFYAVEQVGETYGLHDSTFQKVRPWITMETATVRKIAINSADMEALKSHPYIRWQIANAIIKYREQHGKFKSLEEMQHIGAITPEVYRKMAPYLTVDH